MVCDPAHIKRALDYSALSLSYSQILLVWDKPIGPGYDFKVEVKNGTAIAQVIRGEMGFGNAKAVVIDGLQPSTTYTLYIYHSCSSSPEHYTTAKHTSATTLAKGSP